MAEEQYNYGIELSKEIVKTKEQINFHPELHDQELFDKMMKKDEPQKAETETKEKVDKPKTKKPATKSTKKSKK